MFFRVQRLPPPPPPKARESTRLHRHRGDRHRSILNCLQGFVHVGDDQCGSIQRAALGIGLGIVWLFYAYPDALLSRLAIYEETLMPNSPTSELTHRGWDYPVQNFLRAFDYDRWPYGYGIGTSTLGVQYVARFFNAKPPVGGVESG
jgi:hypothetical protein